MTPRQVASHVRRYPWWYALGVAWLGAMLALPVVELDPLGAVRGGGGGPQVATDRVIEGTVPDLGPGTPVGGAPPTDVGGGGPGESEGVGATTTSVPALELVPPEVLDLVFDAIPPLVFPPLPEELSTVAAAIAPLAATGCTGLGLASIVVAVVAQTAEGVPLERILPYLAPVSAACASFPVARVHTVCAADAPLVIDLGGVTDTPPLLGLGIDQLDALEELMAESFGAAAPRLAPELRTLLDCEIVSE